MLGDPGSCECGEREGPTWWDWFWGHLVTWDWPWSGGLAWRREDKGGQLPNNR